MYGLQEVENAGKKNVNTFTGGTDQDGFDVGVNYLISKDKL
jgi:hypothetical protein